VFERLLSQSWEIEKRSSHVLNQKTFDDLQYVKLECFTSMTSPDLGNWSAQNEGNIKESDEKSIRFSATCIFASLKRMV
jgi:hypothetical protein